MSLLNSPAQTSNPVYGSQQMQFGVNTEVIFLKSAEVKFWGKHLWAREYFAMSSGNVTDEVITEYIKNQDEIEKRAKNDNFTAGF